MDTRKPFLFVSLIILGLSACAGATPTPPGTLPDNGVPGGEEPTDGVVYITTADLLIAESYPIQVSLHITGDLSTPCHEFHYRYEIQAFTEQDKRVDVTAYSVSDPAAICIQVLEPFEARIPIPMEDAPDGDYAVYVNGDFIGEFSYPGG